uniref:Uncharacterized protein n=1 Tax=Oryza brachyantha TaxID=4533 RepID=J3N0J9_ORYBR
GLNSTPVLRPKRFVQKPARYVSPVVVGKPSVSKHEVSIQLRDYLLTKWPTLVYFIELDSHVAVGYDVEESFTNEKLTEGFYIDAFGTILFKDYSCYRPDTFGKRIFIPTSI